MNNDPINLLDVIRIIKKRIKFLFFFPFALSVIVVVIALCLKPTYRAESVIMPLGQSSGAGGLLNLLGGAGGGSGGSSSSSSLSGLASGLMGSGNTSSMKLMAVLDSKTIVEKVIEKVHLAETPEFSDIAKKPQKMVKRFKKKLVITEDKKQSLINITFDSKDKELCARVLDAVLDVLSELVQDYQLDTSKKNRVFIEGRLEANREETLEAGKELTEYYKSKNVSASAPELDVSVSIPKEVDPAVGIQGAIDEMDLKNQQIKERIVKGVPQQVYLEYLIQRKQVLILLNALLSQQYEMARIDEARESISFQVLDAPEVPEEKYFPQIKLLGLIGFVVALFLAIFYVFTAEYLEKLKHQEKSKL